MTNDRTILANELNKAEKKLATANVLEDEIKSILSDFFCLLNQQFRFGMVQLVRAPSCK